MEKTDQRLSAKFKQKLVQGLTGSIMLLSALLAMITKANAIIIISDEETEQFLYKTAEPFFDTAHIPLNPNKLFIVQDDSLNAFVSDGNNLFVNTGTIVQADNTNELSGVIAHETGHISGGHILRGKIQDQSLQKVGLASMVLAGAAAAISGRGDVAMAIALGGQSSALHGFMAYRTEQERSADESAVKFLTANNQSPKGMLEFMKKIQQNNQLSGIEETPYFRTHPITQERVSFLEKATQGSSAPTTSPQDKNFYRIKAKLIAFLEPPQTTFRKYPLSNQSIPARYAHSIAYFKDLKIPQAQKTIDSLIAEEPDNPYFHEVKGQIFMETGKVRQAKNEYQKALDLMPRSALFQINWAQAVLEDNPSPEELKKVVNLLNQALIRRPMAYAWLLLSRAYGELGEEAYSNYAAAEYSLSIGAREVARNQATNAQKSAGNNQKLRLKIDDLLERINVLLENKS